MFVLFLMSGSLNSTLASTDRINVEENPWATRLVSTDSSIRFTTSENLINDFAPQKRAIEILNTAYLNAPVYIYSLVHKGLSASQLVTAPEGQDFEQCVKDEKILAFVLFIGGHPQPKIYLCKSVLSRGDMFLTQVLVHEGAHTAGYIDECDATKVEVSALNHARIPLFFQNGYMNSCQIPSSYRFYVPEP